MSQKKKNPQFRKSVDWDSINKPATPENKVQNYQNARTKKIKEQRYRAKMELINRYHMSEEEAERTLRDIERKAREQRNNGREVKKVKRFIEDDRADVIVPIHVQDKEKAIKSGEYYKRPQTKSTHKKDDSTIYDNENIRKYDSTVVDNKNMGNSSKDEKNLNVKDSSQDIKNIMELKENNEKTNQNSAKKSSPDVDSLISDLVPVNENDLSIEVNNVSLSFEVGKDKIDNLKEYVIRSIKRNKEKRIRFQALKDISFKIHKGEKVGIIGYNGAGKSTLLNVITGIYPPESGEVKTYGRISPLLALGAGFDHNYSGKENIYLNGAILGYDKKFLESKYDEIVEFSELGEFIDFPVKNYSSGMLAKLGFSIATIVEPDILIIDEVLGVGDVNFQKKSSDKIRSLMDKGTTVLLVSHSIPQIRKLCDKAIWIDQGIIVEIGDVNDVCNHYLKDAEKATKDQLKDIRFR